MEILLKIGCDSGSITLKRVYLSDVFLFKINRSEFFEGANEKSITFLTINDAWLAFKTLFPEWHQLYLVTINAQMIDLLKAEYLAVAEKNEYTVDRWLQQLTNHDLGF